MLLKTADITFLVIKFAAGPTFLRSIGTGTTAKNLNEKNDIVRVANIVGQKLRFCFFIWSEDALSRQKMFFY